MTASESVSREELLELAVLEAAGALDEVDGARLNRLFHAAPVALQAEIRAVQAAMVTDPSFLSTEEPVDTLRDRTLTRIRDEISADHAALAPIATIGPRRPSVLSPAEQIVELVELRAANNSVREEASRWNRTAVMWRAAAIVAGALLIVSVYYNLASNQYSARIGQLALDAMAREELSRALGPTYREFAEGGCLVRGLSAARTGFSGAGIAYVNKRSGEALLVAFGLPEEIRYTVRLVGDDGQTTDIGSVQASSHATVLRIVGANSFQLAFGRLELVDPSGAVVLRS